MSGKSMWWEREKAEPNTREIVLRMEARAIVIVKGIVMLLNIFVGAWRV